MTYARETLSLHSMAPDLIPQDAPADAWNSAENVMFRNGESVRAFGDTLTLPTARIPLTAVYAETLGAGFWVFATDAGIFAHDGTLEYDITPTAGWSGADGRTATWTACVLNGLAFLNASDRDPVYWDGNPVNPCEPLPDWPSGGRCLALRAHKSFLFAIGMVSEGVQRVRWSDAAEAGTVPAHWTPAPDNLAGFVDLTPLGAACLDGVTLRDDLVIYKSESMWAATFVGGQYVFSFRKLFVQHGLAATNAVTHGPNAEHLFVGADGDVYLTDGTQVQSVLDGRAQRTFYADFTAERGAKFSVVTLMREKLGVVIYPRAASVDGDLALVYDFTSGDIGAREMPNLLCAAEGRALLDVGDANTWDGDAAFWNNDTTRWNEVFSAQSVEDVVIGGEFGFRLISNPAADTFSDGPVHARLEKHGIAFGDPQRRKQVQRLWPKVVGREGDVLHFRLGGQEHTTGPTQWTPAVAHVIGSGIPVDAFVQGRFISIEVESIDAAGWRMGSMDLEVRGVGTW